MAQFEYKVIPAPTRGEKSRVAKTSADRFGVALTGLLNEMGRDGWEYQRADTLPCEERVGFTGKTTVFQNMLVFRRAIAEAAATGPGPMVLAAPVAMPEQMIPRLGAAEVQAGHAPAVGPVRPELAAE
jgi:hypothetical protein